MLLFINAGLSSYGPLLGAQAETEQWVARSQLVRSVPEWTDTLPPSLTLSLSLSLPRRLFLWVSFNGFSLLLCCFLLLHSLLSVSVTSFTCLFLSHTQEKFPVSLWWKSLAKVWKLHSKPHKQTQAWTWQTCARRLYILTAGRRWSTSCRYRDEIQKVCLKNFNARILEKKKNAPKK